MTHHDLMHGRDYSGQRVTGWLVQEKFDGLRALWTGKELVSRNGERFNAPAWFTAGLPDVPLDGEIYAGVGTLGRISNTLARWKSGADEDWQAVRFMVFDAPEVPGRYLKRLADSILILGQSWRINSHVFCMNPRFEFVESLAELRRDLKRLHARGGEGFILRHPSAAYVAGRTDKVLKFKDRSLY